MLAVSITSVILYLPLLSTRPVSPALVGLVAGGSCDNQGQQSSPRLAQEGTAAIGRTG